jgi:hypothetical protein
MANIKLSESLIGREVERLFSETTASHGEVYENPVLGTHFVYGVDPIEPQKEAAYRAFLAREWFALNSPADAPPLPTNERERQYCKWAAGPLDFFVAQYARSLWDRCDVKEHASFADYVSGVLWEHENGAAGSRLPHSSQVIAELKRRFPPRKLDGLSCFCWSRPGRKKGLSSKESREMKKLAARIRAEDDAVRYLGKFPPEVAFVIARNVEKTLAIKWDAEQEEMIRRGDPREVLCMTDTDKRNLDHAVARIPPDIQSDAAAEQHVIRLLAKLSPDGAWWVAHLVADYEKSKYERSKRSPTECKPDRAKLDQNAAIPNAVRRAEALAESVYGAAEK